MRPKLFCALFGHVLHPEAEQGCHEKGSLEFVEGEREETGLVNVHSEGGVVEEEQEEGEGHKRALVEGKRGVEFGRHATENLGGIGDEEQSTAD